MKVKLGLGFDGPILKPHSHALGELHLGPAAFLQWLEMQLGLESPPAGFTQRVMQYLACLKQADTPERFYHQSLQVDEIGVARHLLGWRDRWYLAGWRGQAFDGPGVGRLNDLAAVETLAQSAVTPGEGQSVQRVLERLETVSLPVSVHCHDPVEAFAPAWQQLLARLQAQSCAGPIEPTATSGSDLARLQQRVLQETVPDEPEPLSGDGSVLVVRAPSRALSATWVAHYCQRRLPEVDDYQVGILCEGNGDAFDAALNERGLPHLSVSQQSPWRPAFQVLPLTLELLWEPLNPHRLLEFLTHPVGPLPRRMRRALAECVAEFPGIGSEHWQQCLEGAVARERERHQDAASADQEEQRLREAVAFWLTHERFREYPGAPLDVLLKRAGGVGDWVAGMIRNLTDQPERLAELALYQRVQNQVRELAAAIKALQDQGDEFINADMLRRLIKSVRGQGSERPDIAAEFMPGLAKLARARVPAACVGPVNQLIWWGADRAVTPGAQGWTRAECARLVANGVAVDNLEAQITWQANSWTRPILAAQEQLICVVHEDAGSHHPVFDHINALVKGLPESPLWDWLQSGLPASLPQAPEAQILTPRPLPGRSRIWSLGQDTELPRRDAESYTSLESFVYGPYLWVLRHIARLRAGALLSVSDQGLLKGNLAHQLFDDFFTAHTDIAVLTPGQISQWCEEHLPLLIDTLGAVLWLPGRTAERERFMADANKALQGLLAQLQAARVVSVEMESRGEGDFVGGRLAGNLDLLATRADGREAVVDIKWGGAKYRREALRNSDYLQLAVYAKLRQQATGRLPAVGYFVIDTRQLLMLDSDYFPEAEIVQPASGESLLEFWQHFEHTWKQRRQQLDRGEIEVAVKGTQPIESLALDEKALPMPDTFEKFSEFHTIVGWGEDA